MEFLDDVKLKTDDGNEYFIAEKIIIEEELYCIVINIKNEADIMYVHADNVNGEFILKNIEDDNIINKLKEKLIQK